MEVQRLEQSKCHVFQLSNERMPLWSFHELSRHTATPQSTCVSNFEENSNLRREFWKFKPPVWILSDLRVVMCPKLLSMWSTTFLRLSLFPWTTWSLRQIGQPKIVFFQRSQSDGVWSLVCVTNRAVGFDLMQRLSHALLIFTKCYSCAKVSAFVVAPYSSSFFGFKSQLSFKTFVHYPPYSIVQNCKVTKPIRTE